MMAGWLVIGSPLHAVQGNLDTSFGTGGKVTTAVGSYSSQVYGMVVQSDGKIVAAGSANTATTDNFAVVRYLESGALDTGFGSGGKTMTALGTGASGTAVAMQADGKILVAGIAANAMDSDFALVRYTASGGLDTGFGSGGKVITPIGTKNDEAHAVAVQGDGKILVAGWSEDSSANANKDFVLVRYTTAGALDSTFGTGGKVITSVGSASDYGNCMVVQPDGKIIVAGTTYNGSNNDFALVRYNTNGTLDTGFGSGGKAVIGFGGATESANGIARQSDGKLVLSGFCSDATNTYFATIRVTASGAVDTSFGTSGQVVTQMGNSGQAAYGVAIQPNGKILVAGYSYIVSDSDFVLLRYTDTGVLDTGFGNAGKVTTYIGNSQDIASCVALQSDARIVVAGYAFAGSGWNMALARYMGEPVPPVASLSSVTALGQDGVTLNGSVNPRGFTTTAQFEYGLTTSYGATAAVTLSPADGSGAQNVTAALTGLSPNTTYHYRLAASNTGGSVTTSDATFTTLTSQQGWRQQYFGTTNNTGSAADSADPDGDGMSNMLEWACGLDPTTRSTLTTPVQTVSSNVEFTYSRSTAAVNAGASFTVEWSDTMTGGDWHTTDVTQQVISSSGGNEQVKATLPVGLGAGRFVHLRVTSP